MNKDGKTIQELPNQGLDIFINEANIIDLSDFDLPFKITRSMIEDKIKDTIRKKIIVLRTDLTNKVGYESKEWHLKAPYLDIDAANWIVENKYLSVCKLIEYSLVSPFIKFLNSINDINHVMDYSYNDLYEDYEIYIATGIPISII